MKDIPYEATCIYNAGITKYQGKYVMVFRNDVRTYGYGTMPLSRIDLGLATSDDLEDPSKVIGMSKLPLIAPRNRL